MVSRVGSNQFTRRLKLRADRFEANAEQMIKDAAMAALEVLVLGTRVDTAKARSNWIVTRDAANIGDIAPYVPYPKGSKGDGAGIDETPNATAALANGMSIINSYRMGVDPDLFITNNVRYLRYIDGTSALTREAADAARAVIKAAKLL